MNIQHFKKIKFNRGSLSLFCKTDYNDSTDYTDNKFMKKKFEDTMTEIIKNNESLLNKVKKQDQPRGISEIKKNDLLKLCETIPQWRRQFFENLVVSDVTDLCNEQDIDF